MIVAASLWSQRRLQHAGHYLYGDGGHDLDQYDVLSELRPHEAKPLAGVPADAEWLSGYVDAQGRQHWIYTRLAPLSPGRCQMCQPTRKGDAP